MNREEWLAARRQHITATDVSAICGLNPWKSPLDVWLEKRGLMEDQVETPAMKMGKRLQPVVLDLYEESTGLSVRRYGDEELVVSDDLPWAAATPDAETVTLDRRVVEAKAVGERSAVQWGEPGTDDAPEYYLCQVAWQMLVTKREAADLAALFGGRDFSIYPVARNAALEAALVSRCERFWHDNVLANIAPEIGGGESAARYLRSKFPRETRPELLTADERVELLAIQLDALRRQRDGAGAEVEQIENLIKAEIGDAAGIAGEHWCATWKKTKDSVVTDHKALAQALGDTLSGMGKLEEALALKKQHTAKKSGTRRFLFTFNREGK